MRKVLTFARLRRNQPNELILLPGRITPNYPEVNSRRISYYCGLDLGPNGHGLSKLLLSESYFAGPMLTVACVPAVPATSEHAANAIGQIAEAIKSDRRMELG
jgi:hypothetical protein